MSIWAIQPIDNSTEVLTSPLRNGIVGAVPVYNSTKSRLGCMTAPARVNPLANVRPSHRVKMALRLLVTGACRTKREASEAAGLHPQYLTMLTAPGGGSDPVKEMMADIEQMMNDKTVDMSIVIQKLGRLGVGKMAQLALMGGNERIQLDAAKSLADRSPETAGIQKVQVDPFSLGAQDAKMLAAALVESAALRNKFADVAENGLVEIDLTQGEKDAMRLPGTESSTVQARNNDEASGDNGSKGDSRELQPGELKLLQ